MTIEAEIEVMSPKTNATTTQNWGKEGTDSPLEPLEGAKSANTLDLSPGKLNLDL